MKQRRYDLFVLIGIVVFAFMLRIWQLGVVPPSPDWDEAALGYNAYSILHTGRDEYGVFLPLSLRSFDDYKPPLYMYLAVPFIGFFGLNLWAIRLPSVVLGTGAVIGCYLLVRSLFKTRKGGEVQKRSYGNITALVASFLLAISPWHIQFSRIAFEANSALFFTIWGVVWFLKGLRKGRYLSLSAVFFALTLYAYHSQRIFSPLFVLLLVYCFRSQLVSHKKSLLWAGIIGILVVLPLVPVLFDTTTLTRLRGTSALADQTRLLSGTISRLEEDRKNHDVVGFIVDNRRVVWAKTLLDGYLSHFSLRWLFLTGDNPRHHAPDTGLLYLWELPFLFYGLFTIAKWGRVMRTILFGWIFLAPVAASPTTELPHAIRTLVFLPSLQIVTAIGFMESMKHVFGFQKKHPVFVTSVGVCAGLFILGNSIVYLHQYFGHLNHETSQSWQYGYEQAVSYVQKQPSYKKVIVSTKLEQPHMFFLYYLRYDPALYLAGGGTASGGFKETRNAFDRFEFRPLHWPEEVRDGSILYVGTPGEIGGTPQHVITYLDGTEAMYIADR